jgi:glutathione S-transferase
LVTIHGVYRSRASRNIWLLEEIGRPWRHEPVIQAYRLADPAAPGAPRNTRTPDFLALSPQGAIPVMEDGDVVLTESLAINLYLARTYGGDLGPRDAVEDALMQQWALYGATAVEPSALLVMYAHAEGRAGTPEGREEIAALKEKLGRPLEVLEGHLVRHGQMVGDRFTVADINMAEIVRYAASDADLMAAYPALASWLEALHARPAFQRMWTKRNAEPAA